MRLTPDFALVEAAQEYRIFLAVLLHDRDTEAIKKITKHYFDLFIQELTC
jgi:hypothetical protein